MTKFCSLMKKIESLTKSTAPPNWTSRFQSMRLWYGTAFRTPDFNYNCVSHRVVTWVNSRATEVADVCIRRRLDQECRSQREKGTRRRLRTSRHLVVAQPTPYRGSRNYGAQQLVIHHYHIYIVHIRNKSNTWWLNTCTMLQTPCRTNHWICLV